jgi:hypothetical protein
MWLLDWLPDFVFQALLVVGVLALVAGYFLNSIPFIGTNAKTIQIAGILLTVVGVWFAGGMSNEAKWQARVQALEAKVAESEKQAAIANGQIDNRANQKVQKVREVQYIVQERLRADAANIDAQCKVTPNVVDLLNTAAQGVKK